MRFEVKREDEDRRKEKVKNEQVSEGGRVAE